MKKILFVLTICFALPALAQDADDALQKALLEPDVTKYPVLEKLRGKDKELAYDYLGQRFGVDAWLLSGPDLMQVVYTVPGKKAAFVGGALIGPDASELSSGMMQDFMKKNPQRSQEILATVRSRALQKQVDAATRAKQNAQMSPGERLWQDLQGIGSIHFGSNPEAPLVYAVLDPAQPATKAVWAQLWPMTQKGQLNLRVAPLALTTGDSIMTIAMILGHEEPAQAWQDMLEGKDISGEQAPDPKGVLAMKATVEFAEKLKLRQVPFLVYRAGADKKVHIIKGMPKDWAGFKAQLKPVL